MAVRYCSPGAVALVSLPNTQKRSHHVPSGPPQSINELTGRRIGRSAKPSALLSLLPHVRHCPFKLLIMNRSTESSCCRSFSSTARSVGASGVMARVGSVGQHLVTASSRSGSALWSDEAHCLSNLGQILQATADPRRSPAIDCLPRARARSLTHRVQRRLSDRDRTAVRPAVRAIARSRQTQGAV